MMQNTCFYKGNECFKLNDAKTIGQGIHGWGIRLAWFSDRQSPNHHPLLHTGGHGSGVKWPTSNTMVASQEPLGSNFTC